MLADLHMEQVGAVVVARVDGEVDMSNANEVGEAIGRQLSNDAVALVLDLTEVSYLDSAGIRVVYEIRGRLQSRGQDMRLAVGPDSPIVDALRVAGVTVAIVTTESADAALASLDLG